MGAQPVQLERRLGAEVLVGFRRAAYGGGVWREISVVDE